MTYLVDANVLSEPTKTSPDPGVVGWLRRNEREIAVDPILLGEVRFGILLLPKGQRRARLDRWFDEGVRRLQCLPWDVQTGLRWAELLAGMEAEPTATGSALLARLTFVDSALVEAAFSLVRHNECNETYVCDPNLDKGAVEQIAQRRRSRSAVVRVSLRRRASVSARLPQSACRVGSVAAGLHEHGATSDLMESRRAFAEKRKPNFEGWDDPYRHWLPTLD